jgi:methionyl aminopeptidase
MARIKIKSKREIEMLRSAGALAAETLLLAGEMCKPGVSTDDINAFVHEYTLKKGGIPAPLGYHGYPKSVCTSINEVVTHGIPSAQILKEGDIINVDITTIIQGYHGDTSATFLVGDVSPIARDLVQTAKQCLDEGIRVAGLSMARFSDIGAMIEDVASEHGYSVVRDYCGHGIGRGFHEEPLVLHYRQGRPGPIIEEGMVFTIEPMINEGDWRVKTLKDGWTSVTIDGKLSAQWEHTVVRTRNGIEILTLP